MKYKIDFNSECNAVVITGYGKVDREGIRSFHNKYLNHERWVPGKNILIDFSELDFSEFRPKDINFIKDLVIGSKNEIGNGKLAIIISSENDFGLARMWEMSTDMFVDISIAVFRDHDEAFLWIKAPVDFEKNI